MPPKVVKRGGAARRGGRVTRSAIKVQNPPMESAHEESDHIGDVSVSDAVESKEETSEVDKSFEEENRLDGSKLSDSFDDYEAAANLDLSKSKFLCGCFDFWLTSLLSNRFHCFDGSKFRFDESLGTLVF